MEEEPEQADEPEKKSVSDSMKVFEPSPEKEAPPALTSLTAPTPEAQSSPTSASAPPTSATASILPATGKSQSDEKSNLVEKTPPVRSNREKMVDFYQEIDPSKVKNVDKMLAAYPAKDLNAAMKKKYGKSPGLLGDEPKTADVPKHTPKTPEEEATIGLTAFYQKHDSTKLGNIPTIAGQYVGRYAELAKALESKYGEAPVLPKDVPKSNSKGAPQAEATPQKSSNSCSCCDIILIFIALLVGCSLPLFGGFYTVCFIQPPNCTSTLPQGATDAAKLGCFCGQVKAVIKTKAVSMSSTELWTWQLKQLSRKAAANSQLLPAMIIEGMQIAQQQPWGEMLSQWTGQSSTPAEPHTEVVPESETVSADADPAEDVSSVQASEVKADGTSEPAAGVAKVAVDLEEEVAANAAAEITVAATAAADETADKAEPSPTDEFLAKWTANKDEVEALPADIDTVETAEANLQAQIVQNLAVSAEPANADLAAAGLEAPAVTKLEAPAAAELEAPAATDETAQPIDEAAAAADRVAPVTDEAAPPLVTDEAAAVPDEAAPTNEGAPVPDELATAVLTDDAPEVAENAAAENAEVESEPAAKADNADLAATPERSDEDCKFRPNMSSRTNAECLEIPGCDWAEIPVGGGLISGSCAAVKEVGSASNAAAELQAPAPTDEAALATDEAAKAAVGKAVPGVASHEDAFKQMQNEVEPAKNEYEKLLQQDEL